MNECDEAYFGWLNENAVDRVPDRLHVWRGAWDHQHSEIDALKHDIERHLTICTEQAERIAELEAALYKIAHEVYTAEGMTKIAKAALLREGEKG